jgi:hypothetical protein
MKATAFAALLCLGLAPPSTVAHAQDAVGWCRYLPNDLDSLVTQLQRSAQPTGITIAAGSQYPSRVPAIHTSERRRTGEDELRYLWLYLTRVIGADSATAAGIFVEERMFRSGPREYWLPVQAQVARALDEELVVGDTVTLFVSLVVAHSLS